MRNVALRVLWLALIGMAIARSARAEGVEEADEPGETGETDEPDPDADTFYQPPVTSGGLFTLKTYPVRELERPLSVTRQITQAKVGFGFDLSNKGAFQTFGLNLEAVHGVRDNFQVMAGVTDAYYFAQFNAYAGIEGSLAWDVIDFRLSARVGRDAEDVSMDPEEVDYQAKDVQASIDLGFPFRYAARPEIGIIALGSLVSFNLNAVNKDEPLFENTGIPDFTPSLGVITNPIPQLSIVVSAALQVVDFDFSKKLRLPATARVQFSVNRRLDIGGELTFLNLRPIDPDDDGMTNGPREPKAPFDDRFLTLFVQSRFGT